MSYGQIYTAISRKSGDNGIDSVFLAIYKATGLDKKDINKKTRQREIVNSRQIVCFYLHEKLKVTLKETANLVGYGDHTTVIHAISTIHDRIKAQDDWTLRILSNMYNQLSF